MSQSQTRRRDHSLGSGVYYAPDKYVGLLRRLLVYLVDGFLLACVLFTLAVVWMLVAQERIGLFWLTALAIVWFYVAVLKPSRVRTLGYRVAGCRIVNLRGERPSVLRMSLRSVLWIFGPFNLIFDLIWCGMDNDQQTLRDRFAGTCVISNDAVPIGEGEIHLAHFNAMGYTLTYPHVVHP